MVSERSSHLRVGSKVVYLLSSHDARKGNNNFMDTGVVSRLDRLEHAEENVNALVALQG